MKQQVYNPFLPLYEYIPDGEPYVFGDRLYLYGSHDAFRGTRFCQNDYVCWSAPVTDVSDWRYEGVIYKKEQDPENRERKARGQMLRCLYAPDVERTAALWNWHLSSSDCLSSHRPSRCRLALGGNRIASEPHRREAGTVSAV